MENIEITYLLIATYAAFAESAPVCQNGTSRYYNQRTHEMVCCADIQCRRGEQPEACTSSSTKPSCQPCPVNTYRPVGRKLSDGMYGRCRAKTSCHFYLDRGNNYTDATCGCPAGYHSDGDGICLPNPVCLKGEGQTMTGNCVRCVHGKTHSDVESDSEPCKPNTICANLGRCTIRPADVWSDSKCSDKPVSDIKNCGAETKNPDEPKVPGHDDDDARLSNKPSPNHSVLIISLIICLPLGVVILILTVLGVVFAVWVHRQQVLESKHRNIAVAVQRQRRDSITKDVFDTVKEYLVYSEAGKYEALGRLLLEDAYDRVKFQADDDNIEKMIKVLDMYQERCHIQGGDLNHMFTAMYRPWYFIGRRQLGFHSVEPEIHRKYENTLGVGNESLFTPFRIIGCCGATARLSSHHSRENLVSEPSVEDLQDGADVAGHREADRRLEQPVAIEVHDETGVTSLPDSQFETHAVHVLYSRRDDDRRLEQPVGIEVHDEAGVTSLPDSQFETSV